MAVKKRLKAVLFDLDETLLTLPIDYEELREELRRLASSFNVECDFRRILEDVEQLSWKLGKSFRKKCYEIICLHERMAALKPIPMSGAVDTLRKLKERGLKVGVVSRNSRECIKDALRNLKMMKFVDVIVGREDTHETKPNPEPILYALSALGVNSDEAVYVGDHPYDLRAASAAGTSFIAFGNKIKDCEKRINDIKELLNLIEPLCT